MNRCLGARALLLLCLPLAAFGQGKSRVFFPRADAVQALAEELDDVRVRGVQPATRDRFDEFLVTLLTDSRAGPITRAATHAVSPWTFLGDLWPHLPEEFVRAGRRRIMEHLGDGSALRSDAIAERVLNALPDSELRAALGPPLLARLLERGAFDRAARLAPHLLPPGTAPEEGAVERIAATFLARSMDPGAPPPQTPPLSAAPPHLARLYTDLNDMHGAAARSTVAYQALSAHGAPLFPGSLAVRVPFPQDVSTLPGGDNAACFHFPAAKGRTVFAFNGTDVLAIDTGQDSPRWHTVLPGPPADLRHTVLAPFVLRDAVYVAAAGTLACVNAASGMLRWCRFARVETDGALAWSHDAPAAPVPINLTPPLAADGVLLVGVTVPASDQIAAFVSAFTPQDGAHLWTVKTGASDARDFLGLASSPLPLAARNGCVYFCPNLGFLAALAIDDGAIHYLRTYPRLDGLAAEYSVRRNTRWLPAAPLAWEDQVIVAPLDCGELLGFDALAGHITMRCARDGGAYVIGAARDRVFIVGDALRAVSLRPENRGQVVYSVPLPGPPLGRGQILGGGIAVPMRTQLVFYAAESGAVLSTHLWETRHGGGTILAAHGGLVVATRQGLDVYRDIAADHAELDALPSDAPLRHLRAARLALKTRDFDAARDALAAHGDPVTALPDRPEVTREKLRVGALLESWLELNIPEDIRLAFSAFRIQFAVSAADAVQALLARGALMEERGHDAEALQDYYRALSRAEGVRLPLRWGLSVDAVPFVTAKVGALLARSPLPHALLGPMEDAARRRLLGAQKVRHVEALRDVARAFPFTEAGQQAYLACARMYLANQNSLAAIQTLTDTLRTYPEGALAHEALLLLAEVYTAGGEASEAQNAYLTILDRFADRQVDHGGAPVPAAAIVRNRLRQLGAADPGPPGRELRLPLARRWVTPRDLLDPTGTLSLLDLQGGVAGATAVIVAGERFLRVYEATHGMHRFTIEAPEGAFTACAIDDGERGLLAVAGRRELLAVPLDTGGAVRWRVPFTADDAPLDSLDDVQISGTELLCLAGSRAVCVDASGTIAWSAKLPARCRPPLVVTATRVMAYAAAQAQVFVLDRASGALLDTLALQTAEPRLTVAPRGVAGSGAVAAHGKDITCLDAGTARLAWRRQLPGLLPENVAWFPEHGNRVYAWGADPVRRWRLAALDAARGNVLWDWTFPPDQRILDVTPAGDDVIVSVGETARSLVALTPSAVETTEKWRRRLYESFDTGTRLHTAGGSVFHGDRETNRLVALSTRTGVVQAEGLSAVRRFLGGRLLRDYRVDEDRLLVLTEGGMAGFTFHDRYRPAACTAHLLLSVLADPADAGAQERLARTLLEDDRPFDALVFLSGSLWDLWPQPGSAKGLWELMGAAQEEAACGRDIVIPCLPAPGDIAIDGFLSERWPIRTALRLDRPHHVAPIQRPDGHVPAWQGPDDLSATFFCAWDAEHFYFALDVRDDVIMLHNPDMMAWNGDCLVLCIDAHGDGGLFPDNDDRMFTLFLTVPPMGPQGDQESETTPAGTFKVRPSEDRTGMVIEAALPWSSFGLEAIGGKVGKGLSFGFNLILVDDDTGDGARQSLSLSGGHVLSWQRDRAWETFVPDRFPRIVLADAGGDAAP